MSEIGVVYIARGKDPNWQQRFIRFIDSWVKHTPGIACQLYIIFKEFETGTDLAWAMDEFSILEPIYLLNYTGHNSFGGGTFREACNHINEPLLCTLVSASEIMHPHWLKKLYDAYNQPNIGLVGCTGSRVSHIHIRDTAILINQEFYLRVSNQFDLMSSKEAYLDFEHGPNNLTIQVLNTGKAICVVEANGIRHPQDWPETTYRGNLENVLVHDRGARDYHDL